jgi:hypothetical protein
LEPPDEDLRFSRKKFAAGPYPAAKAMISNADDRPCRESAAAAHDADGRSVDHGRGL